MDKRPARSPTAKAPKPAAKPPLSREEAVARAAAKTYAEMDAVNRKPIDLALLEAEPWMSKGGSCGFSWNGMPVGRARR
jgi:hypothetical protein